MRQKMVTRSIKSYAITFLCVSTVTAEVTNQTFVFTELPKTDSKILDYAKKLYDTEETKLVSIVDRSEGETLYGLPEVEFLKIAKVLPPRGTKKTDTN